MKLETPIQNSRMLQLYTDKTALLSLVREAWQGTTQGHHLQILTPCSVCPRASQPVAWILPFHELPGKHWMSGRIRFSLHLSRTVRAAHSLGRNQICLAEACRACLSQLPGWGQAAKHSGRSSFPEQCRYPARQGSIPPSETATNSLCWKRTQQTELTARNAPQMPRKGWGPRLMPAAQPIASWEHVTGWPITMEKKVGHYFGHRPAESR